MARRLPTWPGCLRRRVDESIVGGLGDDVLLGGGGADVLYGGSGDDTLALGDDAFVRNQSRESPFEHRPIALRHADLTILGDRGDEMVDLRSAATFSMRLSVGNGGLSEDFPAVRHPRTYVPAIEPQITRSQDSTGTPKSASIRTT